MKTVREIMQIILKCDTCGRGTWYAFFIKYFVKLQMYIVYCSIGVSIAKLPRNAVHYKM